MESLNEAQPLEDAVRMQIVQFDERLIIQRMELADADARLLAFANKVGAADLIDWAARIEYLGPAAQEAFRPRQA